ncbi:MAG: ParB/RepB/Spo0J family partition protein [Phycisphaerales bacterium]|nr:ParB/RepB/Spo0J family partition protein [Phycisphaerales bacterium]
MSSSIHEVQQIELSRLIAHPKNANVMSPSVMAKLRRHIEKTGRYESLVVRPHPTREACFELINGHHRKEILESLGRTHAACVVWDLDDTETLMLLATVNRLGGEDAPGKRLDLLEALADSLAASPAELAKFLPEEEAVLMKLLSEEKPPEMATQPPLTKMTEAFTVFLTAGDKKQLLETLKQTHRDPAKALMIWVNEKQPTHGEGEIHGM